MNPNPYAVSEPELLRSLRVSWRGGFLQDCLGSQLSSGTFHFCQRGPLGFAQVSQGDQRSDLKWHGFSSSRLSVSPTSEVGRIGSFKTLSPLQRREQFLQDCS
jgi:hypothetical protein